jgi:hypothetical protein
MLSSSNSLQGFMGAHALKGNGGSRFFGRFVTIALTVLNVSPDATKALTVIGQRQAIVEYADAVLLRDFRVWITVLDYCIK